MTVELLGPRETSEQDNMEQLKATLLTSTPELEQIGIRLAIIPQVFVRDREIDCVMIFDDLRKTEELFCNSQGIPVKSFVACIEVKQYSSDAVRIHGTHLEVQYDGGWHDATAQAEAQIWALHDFQQYSYLRKKRRNKTSVQSILWLPRVSNNCINFEQINGRVKIAGKNLNWQQLINFCEINKKKKTVQTLVNTEKDNKYHSYDSLVSILTTKIKPTQLDLKRVNALTQKRFDAEKRKYIQKLGEGLLIFRGRAGTGKTFTLIQMAIYLARQGKSTRIVTYNHGLISDMTRIMSIIHDRDKNISPTPKIETRWMLMQELFKLTFGISAVNQEKELYKTAQLDDRENFFLRALKYPGTFLNENIPCCENRAREKKCHCIVNKSETWASISKYQKKFPAPYDFLLVDEGQDWTPEYRDLLYDIFGSNKVIVADGIDQFVSDTRCDWDRGDIVKNRIVPLRVSLRTKAATCDTITDIAKILEVPGWDVKPDKSMMGGRITVLVERQSYRAIECAMKILNEDLSNQPDMFPIDSLVCLPHKGCTPGINYCNVFEAFQKQNNLHYWPGYDYQVRQNREYPIKQTALRAVLYESCRGMEGWTTLCMGLDNFFDYKIIKSGINAVKLRNKMKNDLFFSEALFKERLDAEQKAYALNWLMIPLTRSLDHLVIHLTNANSTLGNVLKKIDHDKINWR